MAAHKQQENIVERIEDNQLMIEEVEIARPYPNLPLPENKLEEISLMLAQGSIAGKVTDEQRERDSHTLSEFTMSAHAIGRQSLIQIGKLVWDAREILSSYRARTFTRWAELTFGNSAAAYNAMHYYDLHRSLPDSDKELLDDVPLTAAQAIARRASSTEEVKELVQSCAGKNGSQCAAILRERIPSVKQSLRRGVIISSELAKMRATFNIIKVLKHKFSPHNINTLKELESDISDLVGLLSCLESA
jgi:hypothetical protein